MATMEAIYLIAPTYAQNLRTNSYHELTHTQPMATVEAIYLIALHMYTSQNLVTNSYHELSHPQPMATMEAIYLIAPSEASISKIKEDFQVEILKSQLSTIGCVCMSLWNEFVKYFCKMYICRAML